MRIKTRTNSNSVVSGPHEGWKLFPDEPNWTNTAGTTPAFVYDHQDESLEDAIGDDGRFRPCIHTTTLKNWPEEDVFPHPPYDQPTTFKVPPTMSRFYMNQDVGVPAPSFSDSQRQAWDREALNTMLPSMYNGFSLINFLIELKDFRQLANAFWNRKGRLKAAVLGQGSDMSNTTLKKTLKKAPLKSLSQAYLNVQFAWRPFVSDLMAIWDNLKNVENSLKEIWQRSGIPQTRHYRLPIEGQFDDVDWENRGPLTEYIYHPWGVDYVASLEMYRRTRYLIPPTYHATCRYFYHVPGALSTLNRVKGWLDAFGVRPDPSVIWNALPFTFIIDWVVDVGGFLRRFSRDNLGLEIHIQDFCSSQKTSVVHEYCLRHVNPRENPFHTGYGKLRVDGTMLSNSYQRHVSIPSIFAALKTSNFNNSELLLGAALIGAGGRSAKD